MTKPSYQLVFAALILWLLANWAGAHGHFCFDGQEPPVSIHMHVLNDHPEHHADEVHQDADIDLVQSVAAKFNKIDVGLILLALLSLLVIFQTRPTFSQHYRCFLPVEFPHLRPLLRAPPFTV